MNINTSNLEAALALKDQAIEKQFDALHTVNAISDASDKCVDRHLWKRYFQLRKEAIDLSTQANALVIEVQ